MSRIGIGHKFIVIMEGFEVCEAYVEDIDGDEVTIRIPETVVVMGISQSLDAGPEPEVDRQLLDEVVVREPARSLRDVDLDSSAID